MQKESLIFYLTYHTTGKPDILATFMTTKLFIRAQDFHSYFVLRWLRQDFGAIDVFKNIDVALGYKFIWTIQKQSILEESSF